MAHVREVTDDDEGGNEMAETKGALSVAPTSPEPRSQSPDLGRREVMPERERLIVFPGMELTLAVPCQALIIFDADLPLDVLSEVPVILNIQPSNASDATTAQVSRLDDIHTLEQLYEELGKREYLRGRFIVLPNVTDGGHGTIIRREFTAKYKNIPCVGGYINGSIENKVGDGNRRKLAGNDSAWGNKKLALFQVSDSRSRDFSQLGQYTTWVKWAKPTAEAIRQACLADTSRITQSEPQLPATVITRLEVSNSRFLSRINLFFSPQYNALIGGRGTGKSTILEYLRWALCDQPPVAQDDGELPDFQKKRKALIAGTLVDFKSTVTVHFLINDVPHVVRRKADTNEVSLKMGDGDFQTCTERDVRNLLPIQAYSQKQLSNIGVKLEELRRFVLAPIKQKLADIQSDLQSTEHDLRDTYGKITTQRSLQTEIQRSEAEQASLTKQVKELRKKVKGLSKEDQQAIERFGQLENEGQIIDEWAGERERVIALLDEAQEATGEMPSLYEDLDHLPNGELIKKMQQHAEAAFDKLHKALESLSGTFNEEQPGEEYKAFDKLQKQWLKSYEKAKKAYEEAKERSATHEATLAEIKKLEKRSKELGRLIANKQKELRRIGNVTAK